MVTKAEMHKKMIKTVIERILPFIMRYPHEDQELLNEFLNLLKKFEKADIYRTELINNYEEYTKGLLGTKKYLQTPFLWFTEAYFQKAKLTLNWSNFKAESFYEYLAKFLRKDPSYYGVFELIRKQTPLSDRKWEQLQYSCRKMSKPLTKDEMKIIEELITIVKNEGIYALDSRVVRKRISVLFPKGIKTNKIITAFLTNLESRWYINFHTSAFGIEKLFFHVQGLKTEINNIISFEDPKNTILCSSDINVSRDKLNDYLGIFYVPKQDINRLTSSLKNLEQKETLRIKELSLIKYNYRGLSLERYKSDKGWPIFSKTDFQKVVNLLGSNKEEQTQTERSLTYITPNFNQNWSFDQHQLPIELIKLYCDVKSNFLFTELPLPLVKDEKKNAILKDNIGFLKQLRYNNIMTVDWIPWRLVFEYSLDSYWIIIQKKYLNNVNYFLKVVPFSMVYESDDKFFIWTHLTSQIVKYLKKELDWEVYPISYYSTPQPTKLDWFNKEELRWKTPRVLLENN